MGLVVCRHVRPGDPRTTVRRHPARGVGAANPAAAQHDLQGGPRPPVGRRGKGMATGSPGATSGVEWGGVLAHSSAPPPPARAPHCQRAPSHRDTHMGAQRGHHPAAPPEGGAPRLTEVHSKTGGPVYDDAPSWLGDILGPLLLMLSTDLAAALHQELDSSDGLRVGWEAVADGNVLALLHRDAAD